ncbi:hypothetical protein CBL_12220 [Carabus blaptoides fortunei]
MSWGTVARCFDATAHSEAANMSRSDRTCAAHAIPSVASPATESYSHSQEGAARPVPPMLSIFRLSAVEAEPVPRPAAASLIKYTQQPQVSAQRDSPLTHFPPHLTPPSALWLAPRVGKKSKVFAGRIHLLPAHVLTNVTITQQPITASAQIHRVRIVASVNYRFRSTQTGIRIRDRVHQALFCAADSNMYAAPCD